jgi:endonuclease-8
MPEGHKTHFIARQHTNFFSGQTLKVTSPQGRFRADARKASQKTLEQVTAVGKHLFYEFESQQLIHIHLGRYGKFRQHPSPPPAPVGQVRMRVVGDNHAMDLNGPTICRVIDADTRDEVIDKLGPDPLAGGSKAAAWHKIQTSKKPIGAILLDQSVIAGIGNIFRAEILHEIGLSPMIAGRELSRADFDRLWRCTLRQMKAGLKHGKIITVTTKQVGVPLAKVDGKDRFRIYGRSNCLVCDHPVEVIEVASRKLYVCPVCQAP